MSPKEGSPLSAAPRAGQTQANPSSLLVPQKYVQDVLQEQLAQTVFRALKEQGGHIYVCGDVTMAGDVLKAVQLIVRQQGQLSAEEAGAFLSKLRVSGVCSVTPPPVRATTATPATGTAPAACPCPPREGREGDIPEVSVCREVTWLLWGAPVPALLGSPGRACSPSIKK